MSGFDLVLALLLVFLPGPCRICRIRSDGAAPSDVSVTGRGRMYEGSLPRLDAWEQPSRHVSSPGVVRR